MLSGAFTPVPQTLAGGFGGSPSSNGAFAVNFAGAADFVNVPNSASLTLGASDFTFEWWMVVNSIAVSDVNLWRKSAGNVFNANPAGIGCRLRGSGFMEFARGCNQPVATRLNTGNNVIVAGVPLHCVLTFSFATGNMRFYKNGAFIKGITYAGAELQPFVDASALQIGKGAENTWANGPVDGFRLYLRELTAQEVATRYAGNEISLVNLAAWWRFNEGTGTSAADSSGNGNTATLTNGPTWVPGIDLDVPISNPTGAFSSPVELAGSFSPVQQPLGALAQPSTLQGGLSQP